METLKINRLDPRAKSIIRAVVLNSLMPILRERNRGDYITHDEIHEATRIAPYSEHWGLLVKHMKRIMLKATGIELFHEPGKNHSYKLATIDEQETDNINRRVKRARGQVNRGIASLGALPDVELDERQRATKHFRIEALKIQQASLRAKDELMEAMRPKRAA